MNSSDLKYMNSQAERILLEHENLLREYYKYQEEKEKAKEETS